MSVISLEKGCAPLWIRGAGVVRTAVTKESRVDIWQQMFISRGIHKLFVLVLLF